MPNSTSLQSPVSHPSFIRELSFSEALRDAIRLAMRRDPNVFVLGEDVGISGGFGGGFTVTLGLSDEFGHARVMDTPISEIAIAGAAVGSAMMGMRPIAEMQYGDFVFCAMDQVINQAAKMCYMSNGQVSVPLVMRLPVGATTRGAQHAQSSEAYFMHTPGLKVVCPSNPYDAKGLLLSAIWDNNPVMLTVTEFLILQALATRPGVVKTRDALMDAAYDDQVYVDDRTIDSHIKRLRKKFKQVDDNFDVIETLYGVGYRFKEA